MSRSPQKEAAPSYEQLPVQIHVKIYPAKKKGGPLAFASVNLNGCFAVQGIKILDSKNGPFVSMPSRKVGTKYMDYCFPCTSEFKRTFDEASWKPTAWRCTDPEAAERPDDGGMNMKG